jgi:hypothetical protein
MATKKKLYRNVFQIEILSEEPLPDDMSLEEIDYQMTDGDCSGAINHKHVNQEVTGRKAAKMVIAQGSDPLFFQMNEFGNEVEE